MKNIRIINWTLTIEGFTVANIYFVLYINLSHDHLNNCVFHSSSNTADFICIIFNSDFLPPKLKQTVLISLMSMVNDWNHSKNYIK